eukprot:TRINITY_DN7407_c0_g1_i2.p1 TRINITY_DN7407_c0_g1~~TRINITY_DN7407_c0_g1_i2.p1  ORF type:complete len:165 (+),score=58.65 TRINITY_DN7407_c0_g1_i2:208-702(+)
MAEGQNVLWLAQELQACREECRQLQIKCAGQGKQIDQLRRDRDQATANEHARTTQLKANATEIGLELQQQRAQVAASGESVRNLELEFAHKEEQLWRESDEWREKHNRLAAILQSKEVSMVAATQELEQDFQVEVMAVKRAAHKQEEEAGCRIRALQEAYRARD